MDIQNEHDVYQPYPPYQEPEAKTFQGNSGFATASLIMGILSIVLLCCFPVLLFPLAGLGILFSCLSKGKYARSGTGKAGMAISVSTFSIATAFVLLMLVIFFSSPKWRYFVSDYMDLLDSENLTYEEMYEFLEKYFYEDESFYPSPEEYDFYTDEYPSYPLPDDYDDFYYGDEAPYFVPETTPNPNMESPTI